MNVYHILNSDFGLKSTMGYRSYQIAQHCEYPIAVTARADFSESDIPVQTIFPGYRNFVRMVQLLGQKGLPYRPLKKIEQRIFEMSVRKKIDSQDIAHFFCFYPRLIEYAKSCGLITMIEGFTHPSYIGSLYQQGIPMDAGVFRPDTDLIRCYEVVDYIISPSQWVTQCLLSANIPATKIVEKNYGVQTRPNRHFQKNKEKIRFMFAGGMKPSKGLNDLLNAWISFTTVCPQKVELHLYGRAYKQTEGLLKQAMDLCRNIFYHGFVKNVSDEYLKNDVYVYPTYYEGSSKTVFEAMSFGLPIITTPNAGSIFRDEIDGFLIPIYKPDAIVDKMLQLTDAQTIEMMGRSAQTYSRHYTWKKYAENVNSFYTQIGSGKANEAEVFYQYQSC